MKKDQFDEIYSKLEEARDELRVQLNLGEKEVKSAWEDFQDDWKQLEQKAEKLRDDASAAGETLGGDVRELIDEVGNSISQLRDRFA